ncbi:5-methyltetrahydropteroyltriglutamate--homocysteine methyltransferase [Sphaerisporangium krabiense]|uniref:5-methyltetrahydropteroyltriglutamate--homocysteine S-methyltransferase n=1 Tax=Sphaerisporangium krabiense TaxID=763782 RepID=A0A7W8Z3G1_9ACTN|nr:5-methyltetrahydropteroyltriglutamate--homocysteine S-methyltransferase [Sphaerisporangium krabiense]MBB5626744.1 5-methyltetrahydropteroyltriglutamate--homocysteine methyltransferase [Sphaerisporangium krabiense]GII63663.1 5-methyltetrahydropteroyltriglutamate--homocysteine methyltransferase [Sphaerisporangium krabiense]
MPAVRTSPFPASTVLGYPRIGPDRELKRALERYWDGHATADELRQEGARVRERTWRRLRSLGLDALPSNTFSYYDQVLDTAVALDAIPDRYRGASPLDTYFAMARGAPDVAPLRMTKWFDTNYHYIVPEIGPDTVFRPVPDKAVAEVREAKALGLDTRPVLIGPVTFLLLAQAPAGAPKGFRPLDRLGDVLDVYGRLLAALAAEGVGWTQLDEPALVADRTGAELDAVRRAYEYLGTLTTRPGLFVASYFGDLGEALPVIARTPVEAVGVDLVRGRTPVQALGEELALKTVVAGVVSGRDVWRAGRERALATLRALRVRVDRVVVSTSCSLLHVPHSLERETGLDPALLRRLAFADEKVAEVVELARLLEAAPRVEPFPAPDVHGDTEAGLPVWETRSPYPVRAAAQAGRLGLPPLPVTTIGSFPQTDELRAARAALARGELPVTGYEDRVRVEIERAVRVQERLGLDVLVHGEPERNDMVQYFAEHLDGFAVTRHGWVQSYGSRCTRPPILHGDVHRPAPITVRWAEYARSLTDRPVKGMLTGPVTIVAWSFLRDDLPLREVMLQVADAVRAEVLDLEAAGVPVIQVDEPALRELMPLRRAAQDAYLAWAVAAYRRATSGAGDRTQIHTHLCYSDADQIIAAVDALDADVTTVESARSHGRVLREPAVRDFGRGLGPGVYDIHSPRVPAAEEVEELLEAVLRVLPAERVWVNPDCGLKTRTYEQVEAALATMVAATGRLRERLARQPSSSSSSV